MKSVLFVCMGNICRSPAGEGALRHLLKERGLGDEVRVDSAGTIGYHAGEPPDRRMIRIAGERGYDLSGQTARKVTTADFTEFDLIVAMDTNNRGDLLRMATDDTQRAKVRMLSHFLPPGGAADVPDPYYGGDRGFHDVIDMVEAAAGPILDALLSGDGRSPS